MDLDRLAAAVRGAARHDHTGGPISYMQEQIRRANVDHAAGREQVFCECITAAQWMAPQLAGRGSMGITTVSARDGGHHQDIGPLPSPTARCYDRGVSAVAAGISEAMMPR
jgi:hypothetical protein